MSWLECRPSGQYHVVFRLGDQKFKKSLRTTSQETALAQRLRLDENIRLMMAGRLTPPEGADIATFLLSDGKLNGRPVAQRRLTLDALFTEYLASLPEGTMESNSLYTAKIHMEHFKRILGKSFSIRELKLSDLQEYVQARGKQTGRRKRRISATTIRKELSTFSAVWSWAKAAGRVDSPFPNKGLRFAKITEKPPFQTREEIERQVLQGGLSEAEQEELWDCLYLTPTDLVKVLKLIKDRAQHPALYPMCVMAAHTGARRSEILRTQIRDFDLKGNMVLIREKKRAKGKRTTRLVPISPLLHSVIEGWLKDHPQCKYAFCQRRMVLDNGQPQEGFSPIAADQATDLLRRVLVGSDWSHLRGWHVFRHSFISNCASKGVDQRMIDAWSGHQTEEMRKRYTHLFPDSQQQAMQLVFGESTIGQ